MESSRELNCKSKICITIEKYVYIKVEGNKII